MSDLLKSLWDLRSPEYTALAETWRANERRFYGGPDVADDLLSFRFEEGTASGARGERSATEAALQAAIRARGTQTLDGYAARQSLAVSPDLMRITAEKFTGALMEHFPVADGEGFDFGTLGDPTDPDTPAGMLWANADGVGADARSLPAFVADEMEAAQATQFRWILTEAPGEPSTNQAEWAEGKRPYLVGLSPLQVPAYQFSQGRLDYAIWHAFDGGTRIEDGKLTNDPKPYLYLMVRKGFDGFGKDYAGGGWWHIDRDGEIMTRADGSAREGSWRTGEIPLKRLYSKRAGKSGSHRPGSGQSGGLTQLGRVQALIMNLDSIAFYDVFTSGKRQRLVTGLSVAAWKHAAEGLREGDPWVAAPDTDLEGRSGQTNVYDSGTVSANEAISRQRDSAMKTARELLMRELSAAPDASGVARSVQFTEGNAPILVAMAENTEEAVTGFLRDMEVRWMGTAKPTASLTMPRRFRLLSVAMALRPVIEQLTAAGTNVPAVMERWVWASLEEAGQVPADPDEADALRAEIKKQLSVGYDRERLLADADRDSLASDPDPEARARGIAEATEASGDSPAAPEA